MQKFVQIFVQFIKKSFYIFLTDYQDDSVLDDRRGVRPGLRCPADSLPQGKHLQEQEQEHQQFRLEGQFLSSQFP